MELTKKERHKIYKQVLNNLNIGIYPLYVCGHLKKSTPELYNLYYNTSISSSKICEKYFPEFWSFRPDRYIANNWWEYDNVGNNSRKAALEFCILMTK